jgi:hypothetical protein
MREHHWIDPDALTFVLKLLDPPVLGQRVAAQVWIHRPQSMLSDAQGQASVGHESVKQKRQFLTCTGNTPPQLWPLPKLVRVPPQHHRALVIESQQTCDSEGLGVNMGDYQPLLVLADVAKIPGHTRQGTIRATGEHGQFPSLGQ